MAKRWTVLSDLERQGRREEVRAVLVEALELARGCVRRTAWLVGCSERGVQRYLARYGVHPGPHQGSRRQDPDPVRRGLLVAARGVLGCGHE